MASATKAERQGVLGRNAAPPIVINPPTRSLSYVAVRSHKCLSSTCTTALELGSIHTRPGGFGQCMEQ